MQTGLKVTVEGKLFTPKAAPDIELIAHRVILSIVNGAAGFGVGFVVSEPKTSGLVVGRPMTTRGAAIQAAEERMSRPGAADHVRQKISALSS